MSSFLPGVLVECGHGPLLRKLFLFIAVGFSNSEKEDEEEEQRGNILQWASAALSSYCWSTGFELGWAFPGFVSCQMKWRGLNKGAAFKGERGSCCLAQLTMPIYTLIKYHALVWGRELPSEKDRPVSPSSAAKGCHWDTLQALWLEQQVPVCSRRTSLHAVQGLWGAEWAVCCIFLVV